MRYILPLVLTIFFLSSCEEKIQGNGKVKQETRESAPFDKIDVSGAYKVIITPGNYSALTIEADENLLEHIKTYVKGGTLHVSSEKSFGRYRELNLLVTIKDFKGIDASGASEIRSEGNLTGDKMEIDFSGAIEANLAIVTQELDGDFSGACEVTFRGSAREVRFETSGAVEIDAQELKSEKCRLDMSGAGEAVVYVTGELDIEVSGAAEVRYKGNPGNVKQDISGAASIKPL